MMGRQNPRRREIAAETRAILVARFPECFMRKGKAKLPLKIGIDRDLAEQCQDIAAAHIRIAMKDYCGGPKYLKAMVEGARRVALDGSDAGFVTADAARAAVFVLDGVNKRIAAARERRDAASVTA